MIVESILDRIGVIKARDWDVLPVTVPSLGNREVEGTIMKTESESPLRYGEIAVRIPLPAPEQRTIIVPGRLALRASRPQKHTNTTYTL